MISLNFIDLFLQISVISINYFLTMYFMIYYQVNCINTDIYYLFNLFRLYIDNSIIFYINLCYCCLAFGYAFIMSFYKFVKMMGYF